MTHSVSGNLPTWRKWWIASRPKTLTAAVTPVLVGVSVAIGAKSFQFLPALAALLVGLLIQIGTNLYNDYADFQRGTDTPDRLGPIRVTQAGLLTAREVRNGAYVCFSLSGLIGLFLIFHAGWPVAVMGAAAIMAGLAYTAGPWALAYNGLGDLFAWIFFGFIAVGGTVFVQLKQVPPLAWMGGLALGGLITALLAVNNIRDIQTDAAAGRRTIPVVFGEAVGHAEYMACVLVAYLTPLSIFLFLDQSWWHLLPLLTIPEALRWGRFILKHEGRDLNQALAGTARLIFWFGLLMSVGNVLASL